MNKRRRPVTPDGSRYVQRVVIPKWPFVFFIASVALLAATDHAWVDQEWKDKQVPERTKSDAKQILTDSPWGLRPPSRRQPFDAGDMILHGKLEPNCHP